MSMDDSETKRAIEALLFATDEPLSIDQMKELMGISDGRGIREVIYELKAEYEKEDRSFEVVEVAGGFRVATQSKYGSWIKRLRQSFRKDKLSGPSLETLAIIAYQQPVTRSEVEFVRGVNVEGILKNLLEIGLIRISGRKPSVGRPFTYSTTRTFLDHFGLNNLSELPKLEEFGEERMKLEEKKRNSSY